MTPLVSKYPWAVELAKEALPEFGRRIRVDSETEQLTGQELDHNPIYETYYTDVMITEFLLGRTEGYNRADRGRFIMPATDRVPRPGDVVTMPNGRRFIIDTVNATAPDGVPVYYDVSFSDG